jgi:hypothetical protein
MTEELSWEGRAVHMIDLDLLAGEECDAAFKRSNYHGAYTTVALAARYVDDGTPVFASVDAVYAVPMKYRGRVLKLAAAAMEANRDADTPAEPEGNDPSS